MIITLSITVGKDYWGNDIVQKQIELKTDSPEITGLPWEAICAGVVQAAIRKWQDQERGREAIDAVELFVDECCVKDSSAWVLNSTLYSAFQEWGGPLSRSGFYRVMQEAGYKDQRTALGHAWQGIELVTEEEQEAETK